MIDGGEIHAQESSEDDIIPDEFSDAEVEDDFEYEQASERFAPRESVSSRGGASRKGTERYNPNKKAPTNDPRFGNQPALKGASKEYEQRQESPNPDQHSESVISEIVENKIVYLDSEIDRNEVSANKLEGHFGDEDDHQHIEEYLDIDKDEYVNKDEYSDEPHDDLPELTEEQQREYDELEKRRQALLIRK